MLAGHPGNPLLQLRRPVHGRTRAAVISNWRIGPIGGQLQSLGHPGQSIQPVGQLGGDGAVAIGQITQDVPLPERVIDILDRQWSPAGGVPSTPAGIGRPQISHQRGNRPAVGGDMVHHDHQHVLVVGDTEKPCPQGDLGSQVKCVACGCTNGVGELACRPAGGIDDPPSEVGPFGGHHQLPGDPFDRREDRAQALMAAHHVGQRRAERLGIEAAAQPQPRRHVVHRGGPLQLVQEPQAALSERQRNHRGPFTGHQRRKPTRLPTDTGRQPGHRGRLEQGSHRKAGIQALVYRGDQAHRQQ